MLFISTAHENGCMSLKRHNCYSFTFLRLLLKNADTPKLQQKSAKHPTLPPSLHTSNVLLFGSSLVRAGGLLDMQLQLSIGLIPVQWASHGHGSQYFLLGYMLFSNSLLYNRESREQKGKYEYKEKYTFQKVEVKGMSVLAFVSEEQARMIGKCVSFLPVVEWLNG